MGEKIEKPMCSKNNIWDEEKRGYRDIQSIDEQDTPRLQRLQIFYENL